MNRFFWSIILVLVMMACSPKPPSFNATFQEQMWNIPEGAQTPFFFRDSANTLWLGYQKAGEVGKAGIVSEFGQQIDIAADSNLLINWADYPNYTVRKSSELLASVFTRRKSAGFHYDLSVVQTNLNQPYESARLAVYPDNIDAEHGFASFATLGGRTSVVWIDGRKFAGIPGQHEHSLAGVSELRGSFIEADGTVSEPVVLDERICDCCRTTSVALADRVLVFYRDRNETEVRDISYLTYKDGKWGTPKTLHDDLWVISGCPVNGPSAVACCDVVYVAWFSATMGINTVHYAWSTNSGETFSEPVVLSKGNASGRVSVVVDEEHRAYVSWLEMSETGKVALKTAKVNRGSFNSPITVDTLEDSRKTGFPVFALHKDSLFAAYTVANGIRVRKSAL